MDRDQAKKQWNSAAPGWAKWEPVIGAWLDQATQAMLDEAGVYPGARVVDIACGAGDQSLAAARRVGPTGFVLATDISEEMIGFVAQQAAVAGLHNVATRCCAAEDLEAGEEIPFDSAICRLGLMLIPDPSAALQAIFHALRAGGRLGAIVVGSPEANPFLSEPLKILRRHANKPPAGGGPGIFALSDAKTLRDLLDGAGFTEVNLRIVDGTFEMASASDAVQMMQDAFGVYRAVMGDQSPETQRAAWAEVLDFLRGLERADGLRVPAQMHVAGAQRPI